MQRMSAIATATRAMVTAVVGTKARILETRKTVPGLRILDKWAVLIGGGSNHRIGLYDMIMIKDNHIAAAGGMAAAVGAASAYVAKAGAMPVRYNCICHVESLNETCSCRRKGRWSPRICGIAAVSVHSEVCARVGCIKLQQHRCPCVRDL